ncbi:hypothetical protein ESCO_001918 [Escovopsis weberi]|uniref:Uncharacterized protein n=1 Tax=Escovopsis weberi TaxID=150374 RepID=A0A0M8N962_ESCWE|nr:hypothetical protein ESCO_001918 [Escovopsis weberi]
MASIQPEGVLAPLYLSEAIVPACAPVQLPAFPACRLPPPRGSNILLIIPTGNKDKMDVIKECVEHHALLGAQVFTETVHVDSGVGEQPYNSAGALGVFNRISNALKTISDDRLASLMEEHGIGTVLVGAIENFVQTKDVPRPADHAVAVLHNATTGEMATACSRGVTLDPEYVGWAMALGCVHGHPDHGKETVGNMLAARFQGLDSKNWHEVLAGVSRYALLREALANLNFTW